MQSLNVKNPYDLTHDVVTWLNELLIEIIHKNCKLKPSGNPILPKSGHRNHHYFPVLGILVKSFDFTMDLITNLTLRERR